LSSYENLTQFLENFALIQRVFHSKDRNLVLKAMSYSSNHLDSLVGALHSYPVSLRNTQKKHAFVSRHLNILEEVREGIANPPIKIHEIDSDAVIR
jgi:hemerythrin-like domain-containing protein